MIKRLSSSFVVEDTDIDITPMLDVVFIMLIFFIVTASFVKESGIGLNSPRAETSTPPINLPIVVQVTAIGKIFIQDRLVGSNAVKPTIIRLKAENPDSAVVVKVAAEAKTKQVVQAVDGIRAANVSLPTVSLY